MIDIARLLIFVMTGLLIGCMVIMLSSAIYYVISDKELLFKIIGESKIIVMGIGFYWFISKLMSKFREK